MFRCETVEDKQRNFDIADIMLNTVLAGAAQDCCCLPHYYMSVTLQAESIKQLMPEDELLRVDAEIIRLLSKVKVVVAK